MTLIYASQCAESAAAPGAAAGADPQASKVAAEAAPPASKVAAEAAPPVEERMKAKSHRVDPLEDRGAVHAVPRAAARKVGTGRGRDLTLPAWMTGAAKSASFFAGICLCGTELT